MIMSERGVYQLNRGRGSVWAGLGAGVGWFDEGWFHLAK